MHSLVYVSPEWPAPTRVKAFTTTRSGGQSSGVYASLNLGDHVGDSAQAVQANRDILAESLNLPSSPNWLNQVHGTQALDLNGFDSSSKPPTADASISRAPGQVCAILTADCMPVFLCDRAGSEVALVHAGWRGLADGIVESTISQMKASAGDIFVWVGPCIGPDRFEVGLEVKQALGGSDACYRASQDSDKVFANLYQVLAERLRVIGVGHYSHSDACTYTDQERFFSYRRDGQCGRMASFIWIDA